MEKLLSVAEAAARLNLSRARVNQLIDSGDLPATRIGRAFVIREVDLELVRERPPVGRPPKSAGEESKKSEKKPAAKKTKKGGAAK